ncbi:class I SAM-dependent methyltransferase [candidate division KSB1 bacterium]|nr:class I SAM-dependent methyltransferase [candidate division KSB1 bacterium]
MMTSTTQSAAAFYMHVASKYKRAFLLNRLVLPEPKTLIPEIELSDGINLLDVGCNNGALLFALADILQRFEFHGVDPNPKNIQTCNKKNKSSSIFFKTAALDQLPYDDNTFDFITAANLLRNLQQRVRVIDEMHRVLKPCGKLYLLEGMLGNEYKQKYDKMLRQTKFIQPRRKYLSRSCLLSKSYLIIAEK